MSAIVQGNIRDVRGYVSGATTLAQVYPIGALYTETTGVNPNTTFGFGGWSAFGQGRVLIGAGTSDQTFTAGATGGESNHTLTIPEMPSHNHSLPIVNVGEGNNGTGDKANYNHGSSSTGSSGGGAAHNNIQPYIVVYFWLRTS